MRLNLKKTAMTALATIWLCTAPPASAQFSSDAAFLLEIIAVLGTILTESQQVAAATERFIEDGDFGALLPLLDDIEGLQQLLDQAELLSFEVNNVIDDFDAVFAGDFDDFDLAQTVQSIDLINDTTRESVERLLEQGAATVESQRPTAARVASVTGIGAVSSPAASLQSLVQLQAEQIGQISRLQTVLVTQGRVLGLQAAEVADAKKRAKRLLELDDPTVFATDEPVGVRIGSELE